MRVFEEPQRKPIWGKYLNYLVLVVLDTKLVYINFFRRFGWPRNLSQFEDILGNGIGEFFLSLLRHLRST